MDRFAPIAPVAVASAALLVLLAGAACAAPETEVLHYDARVKVRPSADGVRVSGRVAVDARANAARTFALDAVGFESVEVTSAPPAEWAYDGRVIRGRWSAPTSGPVTIEVKWATTPTQGVTRTDGGIWTAFHTWRWMPAQSAPGARSTLALRVDAPRGWTAIATGDGPRRPGADLVSTAPHPPYTYGFFVGPVGPPAIDGGLEIWGLPKADAERVLARTRAARDRWQARLGPLPERYVQVFVPGRAAQELAGMAFISRHHGESLAAAPEEDWLIVHELAHLAWGNRVTCATWGDFWLNEAVVVWWVARDKQLRGQAEAYARELDLWRKRVERALARGDDPRIARPGVDHPDAGGSIVYHAGALLVADLAAAVGVEVFEKILAEHIRRAGQSGLALTTDAFLTALPLSAAQREAARCRLADAGARCAPISGPRPAPAPGRTGGG